MVVRKSEAVGAEGMPCAVLVHGSMDRRESFREVTAALTHIRVVTYTRRGYQGSRWPGSGGADFDTHVRDLIDIVTGGLWVAVGHSYGGNIALAAAERCPSAIRAVVAYEPPRYWVPWWPRDSTGAVAVSAGRDAENPGDAAEAFLRRALGTERWEKLPEATKARRRRDGVALLAELSDVVDRKTAPYLAGNIKVPAMVAYGGRSGTRQERSARSLAGQMPRGEVVRIEGAGHRAHISHPIAFAGLVRRALGRIEP